MGPEAAGFPDLPPARFPLEKFLLTCSRFACILSQVSFLSPFRGGWKDHRGDVSKWS